MIHTQDTLLGSPQDYSNIPGVQRLIEVGKRSSIFHKRVDGVGDEDTFLRYYETVARPRAKEATKGQLLLKLVQGNGRAHGPGPHNIKVCLVKKDNSKEVWNRVLELAGPRPAKRFW